jgi:hypothetical protein
MKKRQKITPEIVHYSPYSSKCSDYSCSENCSDAFLPGTKYPGAKLHKDESVPNQPKKWVQSFHDKKCIFTVISDVERHKVEGVYNIILEGVQKYVLLYCQETETSTEWFAISEQYRDGLGHILYGYRVI